MEEPSNSNESLLLSPLTDNGSSRHNSKRAEAPFDLSRDDPVINSGGLLDRDGVIHAIANAPAPIDGEGLLGEKLEAELASLSEKLSEKCLILEKRTRVLQEWIATTFDVKDIPAWVSDYQKRKEERLSAETVAIAQPQSAGEAASGSTTASNKPTTLRLKIGNIAKDSTSQAPARGTGSKNLSRMNRPKSKGSTCTSGGNNSSTANNPQVKIPNQTSITVFWNYVEAYFRNIDESTDLKFLDDSAHIVDPTPFTIPPLGRRYEEQWYEQYGYVVEAHGGQSSSQSPKRPRLAMVPSTVSLRHRILSMLLEAPESNKLVENRNEEEEEEQFEAVDENVIDEENISSNTLDERIRQDLGSLGFPEFSQSNLPQHSEDDAICVEMRKLQVQLREQVCLNHYRKSVLNAIVREYLPAQEFYSLMADLDKQIEHFYLKRTKGGKRKTKKATSESSGADLSNSTETGMRLLEARERLLEAFASIIPPLPEVLASRSPDEPIFDKTVEAKVLETASNTGNWLPIPLIDPLQSRTTQPVFPPRDL